MPIEIKNLDTRIKDVVVRIAQEFIAASYPSANIVRNGDTVTITIKDKLGTSTAQIKDGVNATVTDPATAQKSGLMSAEDKTKLDGIASGAQVNAITGIKVGSDTNARTGLVTITKNDLGLGNVDNTPDDEKIVLAATALANYVKIALSGAVFGETNFDGSQSVTIDVSALDMSYATKGILPIARGGTGRADGKSTGLVDSHTLKVNLEYESGASFDGTADQLSIGVTGILAEEHGGTGVTSLEQFLAKRDGIGNIIADTYAPKASPTLTGIPTAPTPSAGTNSSQIATTAFVRTEINNTLSAAQAVSYKGTLGTNGDITELPSIHTVGWLYYIGTAGTYAGQVCEVGDFLVCKKSGSVANDDDWSVWQKNIDGAVTGPSSAVADRIAIFNGTSGKVIKDSGFTIAKSVPSDAKFTDTTYSVVTTSANGLMSKEMLTKLNGINTGATKVSFTQNLTSGTKVGSIVINDTTTDLYCQTNTDTHWTTTFFAGAKDAKSNAETTNGNTYLKVYDNNTVRGQINLKGTGATTVTSDANGVVTINSTNTTYSVASSSANGLMSKDDKAKLDGIASNANAYTLPTGAKDVLGGVKTSSTVTSTSGLTASPIINGIVYYKDTNTTYSAGSGLSLSGTTFSLALTKDLVTTALGYTPPTTNTTYSNFVKSGSGAKAGLVPAPSTTAGTTKYLREDGTWQVPPDTNTVYTHPTTAGNKHIPSGGSSGQFLGWSADGTAKWVNNPNTNTWTAMKGATSSADGSVGYVNAVPPKANYNTAYLRADGTWSVPPNTGDTHWTTTLFAGAKDAKSNAATSNGNSYIKLFDNNTLRSQIIIKGSGATSVATDANGTITISSTDNNTTYTAASAAPKANGTAAVGTSAKYAREDHVHPLQTTVSGSSGSCTGNAATATKATQDGSGNIITSYYTTLSTDQTISGKKTFSKSIYSTSADLIHYVNSASEKYGAILRADGSDVYLLLTDAAKDASASWNTLRPFTVHCADGRVTLGNGVKVTQAGSSPTNGVLLQAATNNYAISISSTNVTKGTAPSSNINQAIDFYGKTITSYKNRVGMIESTTYTDNSTRMALVAYNATSAEATGTCEIAVKVDKSGNPYTYAPTPADNDNTTKIATTAWVQKFCGTTKKYLTSHQSLSNYSTLANTIKALSVSGKTITYTKGDGTTGTITTQDTNTTYNASSWANMFGANVALSNGTINVANGATFTYTVSANITFSFTGAASGRAATFSLILTNGGSKTVTWPSSVKWTSGSVPALTASGVDILTFITPNGGTTWYGVVSSQNAK